MKDNLGFSFRRRVSLCCCSHTRLSSFALVVWLLIVSSFISATQKPAGKPVQEQPDKRGLGVKPKTDAKKDVVAEQTAAKPELIMQTGHSDSVNAVAFSPNGRWLASASRDHTVKLWQVTTGREVRTLIGHTETVEDVAFGPDGSLLASCSNDKTVKVWEVDTGRCLYTLRNEKWVDSIAFSPDGRWLAYCNGNEVKIWEVATEQEARTFKGHSGGVHQVVFSPNGRWLASRGLDHPKSRVRLWDTGTWGEARSFEDCISSAFSPDGRSLALRKGSPRSGVVELIDLDSGNVVRTFSTTCGATKMVFSRDGKLIVADCATCIRLWRLDTGLEIPIGEGKLFGLSGLDINSDGTLIASGGSTRVASGLSKGEIHLWETNSGRKFRTLSSHTAGVMQAAVSQDGRRLMLDLDDRTATLWDLNTGNQTNRIPAFFSGALSPDGHWLASTDGNRNIKMWDLSKLTQPRAFVGHTGKVLVGNLAFSPDSRLLASASGFDRTVRLWNVETGTQLKVVASSVELTPLILKQMGTSKYRREQIESFGVTIRLAFAPDGRTLAVSIEQIIFLFDVNSGSKLREFEITTKAVSKISFSRDGKLLITAAQSEPVRIWDLETGRLAKAVGGQASDVNSLAFSPDGRILVTGSHDRRATVWDVGSGRQLRTFANHPESVKTVAFGPDGRSLISLSASSGLVDASWAIKSLELSTGRELPNVWTMKGDTAHCISRDGSWLAIATSRWLDKEATRKEEVKLFDLATGRQVGTFSTNHKMKALVFSPDGRLLASGSNDSTIKFWDVTGREVRTLIGNERQVLAVAFSPDGRLLASGEKGYSAEGFGGTVRLWEVATGRELFKLTGHRIEVRAVTFNPNARVLASAGDDGTVKIWDVATGRLLRTLSGPGGNAIVFSPDGKMLASGGIGGAQIWEVETGLPIIKLGGGTGHTNDAAFIQDGKAIATIYGDEATMKLWDIAIGGETATLTGHTNDINAVVPFPSGYWLLSVSKDGSARLWDSQTGQLIATLVSLREEGDWLVVTPDGLFDGSPGAWDRIAWRFAGNDIAPVETFFNEFFHPGLLADILAGKRPRADRDILEVDRRQPAVKLALAEAQPSPGGTISSRNVSLKIEVAETQADPTHPSGSGARDIRLFRNGSLVKAWRGDVLKGKQGKIVLETTISVVAGENRLVAYAFNRDNIKSADATLVVTGAESLKRKGTAYIIAIGVDHYANRDYDLKYAVADAQAFAEELQRQQTKLASYANIEVIPLIDREATKANILEALKRLAGDPDVASASHVPAVLQKMRHSQPEDAVIVYFAGHGTAQQSRFYLIPHDLGYSGSRTALTEAGLKTILSHSISDVDLERALEKVDAGQLLLVIDACNSGQALEAEEKRRGPMNSKGLAQLAYEKGMYILTAAQGYQAALEAAQLGHGYLTYALVEEGLKTAAADGQPKDGLVAVREWLDYATLRVPQMQMTKMQEARALKHAVAFVEGEEKLDDVAKRSLQRPRVFYRREPETQSLIVAKP
jgi:WD40 repeat protein/uncharacterized caspase-like protein